MPKQRFYIYSIEGCGYMLAWRLLQEGYEVVVNCEDKFMRQNLTGIVPISSRMPRGGDVVVIDDAGRGEWAEELRSEGYAVVGGSALADVMAMDNGFAATCWEKCELATPESKQFSEVSAAVEFVSSRGGRWIFKSSDGTDDPFIYCARDEIDMVAMLLHIQSVIGNDTDFVLQAFVEGVDITTEGWFDGEQWIEGSWNSTIVSRGLYSGNIGPEVDCSWCVVWAYEQMPRLAKEVHEKLTSMLTEDGYIGPWGMHCVVNESGVYVLDAVPRFRFDALAAYASLMKLLLGDSLIALAQQEVTLWSVAWDEVAASLRLAIKPYPFGGQDFHASGDLPVRYRHEDENYLWLTGVQRTKHGLCSAPTDGVIGCVTAVGKSSYGSPHEVCGEALDRAQRLTIPGLMYRNDIGVGVSEQWSRLEIRGYETPIRAMAAGYSLPEAVAVPSSS